MIIKKRPEQNRSARDGNIHNVPRGTTQVAACDNHPAAPLILNADNSDTPGLFALAYRLGSVLSARGVSSHGSQPAAMPLCLKTRDTRLFHRRFNYGVHYKPVKCSCQDLFCNLFSFFAKIAAFMKVNRILRHIYIEFDIFPFFGLYLLKRLNRPKGGQASPSLLPQFASNRQPLREPRPYISNFKKRRSYPWLILSRLRTGSAKSLLP